MCLAIPGRLIETYEDHGLPMGRVDYAGTINGACLAFTPDARVGQYLLVHAGFALNVLDEAEAARSLEAWGDLVRIAEAEGTDLFGIPLDLDLPDKELGPS